MGRISWVFRLGLVIGAGALLVTSIVVGIAPRLWRIANAHTEVPVELPEFLSLAQRTYIYDANDNEIGIYELENSQPVPLSDVPPDVIEAFLAVEDQQFWIHDGVNVRSLFRATLSSFATDSAQQGASTITMQVVKNDFLAGFDRDGRYKLLQIVYARRLEREKTKQEILERYLNTVFFGNNSYGIAAAAETYFGKTVADLTFVEAAFLAGLVQSPSGHDPIRNPERSRTRFLIVMDRLVEGGYLTDEEAEAEIATFVLPERTKRLATRVTERTYYSEALREYLLNRSDILGDTYQERFGRLFRGGLRIHTTLDANLQVAAEQARNELPDSAQGFDAALVSLDTKSGAIRAMVGGRGFVPGRNEVNLALAPSQTGSSIKLFILAAAVQAGAQTTDMIDGTRGCKLPTGNPNDPVFQITGGVSGGIFSLREQTYRSVNCAFARLSQIVGLNRMVDTTYRMAASPYLYPGQPAEDHRPIEPFASFATGANEMSPLDMAAGMQTIANEGTHHQPYYVDWIDDAEGNRLYTQEDIGTQELDRDVALTTIDMMKDVLTKGTARRELADFAAIRPAAGKTGTQDSNTTAWFVGGTPYLSTAVVVRDPDRYTEMNGVPEFVAAGVSKVQGGTFPARIWDAYMTPAHQFEPITDWPEPPPPARGALRLYLPGVECLYRLVGYQPAPTAPPTAAPAEDVSERQGVRAPQAAPETTAPPTGTTVPEAPPPVTAPPRPIYRQIDSGTTIPPDVIDRYAPLPAAELGISVRPC